MISFFTQPMVEYSLVNCQYVFFGFGIPYNEMPRIQEYSWQKKLISKDNDKHPRIKDSG